MKTLSLCVLCVLCATLSLPAATVESFHATTLTSTNRVRYTGHPVGRVDYIDARGVLPATATVVVHRVYSTGTDTVATVVCAARLGRAAPNTNSWYCIYNEYLDYTGATSATVRVITSGSP